jgi:peroxiredoxin
MKWRGLDESSSAGVSVRTLTQVLQERRELGERYTPAEVVALYQRAIDEIGSSGLLERALKPGDPAPRFELPDENFKPVTSETLLGHGNAILCFFRGRWCPFDVAQLEAMNEVVPQIQAAGASLVAISPQTQHQAFLMHDQHKLRFPLLSDEGNKVARHFRLTYRVPPTEEAVYRRAFVNLPFIDGDDSWELPIPATYVIEGDGTIIYAYANEDYIERPEPSKILAVLQSSRVNER